MNSAAYNRLNPRRESSAGGDDSPRDVDGDISKNSMFPIRENKQVTRRDNSIREDVLESLQPYSVRSASLSRPTTERRVVPVPPSKVFFSHPFQKTPSTPSFETYNPNNLLHLQQPQLQMMKTTSSSSLATDHRTPGKISHDYYKPLPAPARTSAVAQQLRVRSASVTPSSFQPQMIGYYPVDCPEKPSDWRQVDKESSREKEVCHEMLLMLKL